MNDALPTITASDARLAALHDRLEQRADDVGVLDVALAPIDSPIGQLLLAATERGLLRVVFDNEDHDAVLAGIARRVSPRILRAPRRLDAVRRELDEYFAGRRREFDVPLDFALSSRFRREVQQLLPTIRYGTTATYAQLAARIGSPRAARAVGSACATNPLPVVVPCHRVLRTDGSLGGYLGGLDTKTALLRLEGAA
ncbi:methylated-DNA--[protein]-cysteine S-methyltransferase [Rhodococcus rhodnii]|uniref:Methylated-DNA--protein-cysteine methyltransferase n=2 Tax=Rhodococcus rhodnii TaxID=38312 RepID=R7WH70_9NOCA|nr:methylated-DNA--[protein]-cysteine S-methyltransferase [Rhodococcus rhodnii]EOM74448.1 methylated-DNA--[protein]-cysteine [Rhodococcus rhodnii LMG 5362]TXG89150.1 methylated-DNA--[protein]-cysteine S-methyltransferase [Rhodococcus rhodnii]